MSFTREACLNTLPLTALSEEEELLRRSVREWAENRLRPLVRAMDEHGQFDAGLLADLFRLGWMGIQVPGEFGGGEGSFFDAALVVEELSRVDPSAGLVVDVQNTLVNNAILRWGDAEQRRRLLPALAGGKVGAYALSEAGSGSDAFSLVTRARREGDGYRINGRKLWISNASEAGLFILFANLNPEAGHRGITAFLVEASTPGFALGRKEDKLGIRASSTCELILENCFVSADNLLGEPGQGYKVAIETLNEGRIGIGAQMLGLAQGAADCATRYVQERRQFGKAIADFQGIRFQLATMHVEIEAARLLVYNAARLRDAGQPFIKQAAMAKYYSSMVAERVASQAVELYGGYGFVKDYPVEKFYRDAKIGKIYEGTSNLQLETIAKLVLKS